MKASATGDVIVEFGWLGLIELFVALMFVSAWGCLELYTKRFDKRSAEQESRGAVDKHTPGKT